jgi:DNA-binding LacI/PurR family transcriptional regulator
MPSGPQSDVEALVHNVAQGIERLVNEGSYPAHSRLASERDLARKYQVKRHIVRRAIDSLEQKGRVYRLERGGTFVQSGIPAAQMPGAASGLKGVAFVEHNWPYVPEWLQGALLSGYSRVLEQHALRVRFLRQPQTASEYEGLVLPFLEPGSQGCVLGNTLDVALMEWLRARGVAYVVRMYTAYDYEAYPPHHGVCVNRNAGGFHAAQHLLQLGHRRIGFLGWLPQSRARQLTYGTYEAALSLAGIPVNPDYVADVTGVSAEESVAPALRILRLERRPTAIVAHNDFTAFGVYHAAAQLGLRIPEDLSVVGYDDHPEAARCSPGLTTFHNKVGDLAEACLELLLDVAAGRAAEWQRRVIEAPFVLRGSTGRVPQ